MESKRLLAILSELETNLAELERKQADTQSTPKFKSLETLISYHKELQALQQEQEILEKIRPVLTQEIERVLQREAQAMCKHKLTASNKETKKVVAQLKNVGHCTVEQSRALLQLSKINGGK